MKCQADGENHSDDITEVWIGRTVACYLCGYHALPANIKESIRSATAAAQTEEI